MVISNVCSPTPRRKGSIKKSDEPDHVIKLVLAHNNILTDIGGGGGGGGGGGEMGGVNILCYFPW